MSERRSLCWSFRIHPACLLCAVVAGGSPAFVSAQLPALAPTQNAQPGNTAPLAATASVGTRSAEAGHAAKVTCTGGLLEVDAQNSSLNGILRAISRCTGMRITGGVAEQRVFGVYGPAAPATVLATLIDGTGSNMLLHETAADQPAELILTPRLGGATPPPPAASSEDEETVDVNGNLGAPMTPSADNPYSLRNHAPLRRPGLPPSGYPAQNAGQNSGNVTPVPQPQQGSAVTSPSAIPIGTNNVLGSPNNTSPTAASYPTTNSVPLDSLPTPSTTPSPSGIVDAPNPPAAGSDTAAALNGAPNGTPGTTNINPGATGQTSTPGASNSTVPAPGQNNPVQAPTDLTPEQIFRQLQQRQQQQQQQEQQQQQQPQDTSPQ